MARSARALDYGAAVMARHQQTGRQANIRDEAPV
jgi:hypothetical protein